MSLEVGCLLPEHQALDAPEPDVALGLDLSTAVPHHVAVIQIH